MTLPRRAPTRGSPVVPRGGETILRALGTPSPAILDAWVQKFPPTIEVVDWLRYQGLAPLAFHRLTTGDLVGHLKPAVASALQHQAQQAAAVEILRAQDLADVMRALSLAGVQFVLLKGSVLAYSVYPDPSCRGRRDIDLWIDPADHERAASSLGELGYHFAEKRDRPHPLVLTFGGEMQLVNDRLGRGLVELQWPAFRGEWCRIATSIDNATAWARRTPFELPGSTTGAKMAPEDQLLHLAVHFGINHQFAEPHLRAALDLHLLVTASDLDWGALATRAREWRIATVTWTALSLAVRFFGTPIPPPMLATLRPGPVRRAFLSGFHLERSLLRGRTSSYSVRRGLLWLLMSDTFSSALSFLTRTLAPEREWLRARWGAAPDAPVLPLLAKHWRSLIVERRT